MSRENQHQKNEPWEPKQKTVSYLVTYRGRTVRKVSSLLGSKKRRGASAGIGGGLLEDQWEEKEETEQFSKELHKHAAGLLSLKINR